MNKQECKRNIWIFYFSSFLDQFVVWIPFLVLYATRDIGMKYSDYMVTEIVFSIAVLLLEVPTGLVSDLISRKLSWILGTFLLLVGGILMALMDSFWLLLLSQAVWAFYKAFHSGSNQALIYDSLLIAGEEKRYPKILSTQRAIVSLSVLLSSIVGGLILNISNMKVLFWIYPCIVLLSLIMTFFLVEPPREKKENESTFFLEIINSVKLIFDHKKLIPLIIFMSVIPAFTKSVFWLMTPLLLRLGVAENQWGNIHAINRGLGVVVLLLIPLLFSLKAKKRLYLLSDIFVVMGMAFLFSTNLFIAVFGFILVINSRFVVEIFANNELNEKIKSARRATLFSLVSVLSSLIFVVGSYFSTLIFDNFGFESSLFFLIFFYVIPAIFISLKFKFQKV